jgi:hypothetical protein
MPPPPEIRNACGKVRASEVELEVKAKQPSDADSN